MQWTKNVLPIKTGKVNVPVAGTWIEKYLTFEQDHSNELHQTDTHFLAEFLMRGRNDFDGYNASLFMNDALSPIVNYCHTDKIAFSQAPYFYIRKSISHDNLSSLELQHPATNEYSWEFRGPEGSTKLDSVLIGGPKGVTQIPKTSKICLTQNNLAVLDYDDIDPDLDLVIEWSSFKDGQAAHGNGWDDIIFVLVSNRAGEIILTGGAEGTDDPFIGFSATSAKLAKERITCGEQYVIFISHVKLVHQSFSHGIHQVACNSFATELKIKTRGNPADPKNTVVEKPAQHLWTRKTRGTEMQTWPTLEDFY